MSDLQVQVDPRVSCLVKQLYWIFHCSQEEGDLELEDDGSECDPDLSQVEMYDNSTKTCVNKDCLF